MSARGETSISEVTESSAAINVVAGVDTHADTHHVAVLSMTGGRLGERQIPATTAGSETLLTYIGTISLTVYPAVSLVAFSGRESVTESDGKGVQSGLPTHRPSGPAGPGRVEGPGDQIQAL
jgi:hypothetical protein